MTEEGLASFRQYPMKRATRGASHKSTSARDPTFISEGSESAGQCYTSEYKIAQGGCKRGGQRAGMWIPSAHSFALYISLSCAHYVPLEQLIFLSACEYQQ